MRYHNFDAYNIRVLNEQNNNKQSNYQTRSWKK